MSEDTIQGPTRELLGHLTDQLGGDPVWADALGRLGSGAVSLHLALLAEPFLSLLMDGSKTIESRFSRVRCAPYGCLAEGDVVAVKKTGGAVVGAFIAGPVAGYQLTGDRIDELRERFAARIRATGEEFWAERADCAYATLVEVSHLRSLPAIAFPKKDRRGWVLLRGRRASP
ncbi:hypothetical protein FM076_31780 [Streptomyces albus subsp. chlorinus]|uniref:ASCH domain-containing protein n=1 Tax=Streptomyces albus subsp. chlorinus TaxID=337066 RepID=A0A386KRQ0_9ACTN|nr:hypothetical protein [Streptomyces albus]AYD88517.1 hypothetical protein [Streptomyces albus subsp. chlorinus]NSC25489.1 hypothetical protein [Streptomyces albus subsp. chlorinus]